LSDITRSRADLITENLILRQQLIVLKRQVKRPQLTNGDRLRLILLARCTQFWQQALLIVQPDTLLRWHRDLFRLYWRHKSRHKKRQPRVAPETIALIRRMAEENRLWGAERIRGELLKLGVRVSKRTIQKYMPKVRRELSQTWATFLKNHAGDIWTCDFAVAHDLLFRPLYIFVVMELQSRRIVHTAVTRSPIDDWTAQQLREATPWGKGTRYLVCDRDNKYGPLFLNVARATGIQVLRTPVRAPKANAICERFIGSLKRECLDHMLILHCYQLHRFVRVYVDYYNHSRPHQGIGQRVPARFPRTYPPPSGQIIAMPVLGGLYHAYSRAAYLH
ncbi:MAG TPA: integrase core domain-containing protein, partial [Anaerolineae bacterium]|nr:integrase core domain-containing protein [Anaerolineae bacterium]